MTLQPQRFDEARLREMRDATKSQARAIPGVTVALVGGVLVVLAMAAVVVLDYQFHQPIHRLIKLMAAGALGLSVLFKPWIGMLAFPVIAPFLPWIPPVPLPGVNALNLLLGTVFVTFAIQRVTSGQPVARPGRLGLTIALLMGIIVLAVVRGGAFPTGYHYELRDSATEAFRTIVGLAVYFVALSMARGEGARRALAWAVVLGFMAEAATTILLGRNGRGMRATGSIGQANDLGAFLAMYAAMTAALIPAVRSLLGRLVLLAATVAGCWGIVLTVSRGSIAAAGVALLYVGFKSSRLLTVGLLLAGLTSPMWAPDFLKDRMLGTGAEEQAEAEFEPSAQLRVDTWRAIIQLVSDHPLDGVGFAGLAFVLPQTGEELGVEVKDSSHNTFLRMLGEMGVFGLGLFVVLLWKCWSLARDGQRRARTRLDRQLAVGLAAGTLSLVVSCAFGDRFFNVLVTSGFWVVCALVEDSLAQSREPAASRPEAAS